MSIKDVQFSTSFKIIELLTFFILLPLLTKWYISGFYIAIPLLIVFGLFLLVLLKDPSFDNKILYTLRPYDWRNAVMRFLGIAVVAFLFTWFVFPDLLLQFALENTDKYFLMLLLYPFVSVIPQELVYRTYFFHRYRNLFPNEKLMYLTNALLFAFLHIIYNNWLAPIAAFLGSWIFIYNYSKTKSLVNVCIEHYFYGVGIFTLGLGKFFK